MIGETVAVLTRHEIGTDSMGEPVYEWESERVTEVIVRPMSGVSSESYGSEFTSGGSGSLPRRPDGVKVDYTLAFPSSWTSTKPAGYLRNARVALVSRGMDDSDAASALRVVGAPDRTIPSPVMWDMNVEVGRTDG